MWEEAIPWIWGWAQGWLTPAVLFVLLNLVIGTIAVTSKGIVPRDPQPPGGAGAELHPAEAAPRKLPRAPSRLLDRVRSFTLHSHPNLRGAAPPPRPQALVDPLPDPVPAAAEDGNRADPEEDEVDEEEEELRLPHGHQLGRSHSDAHPAAGESPPPPLAARMKKSASEKSAFAHFEAAEVADAVAELCDEDEDEDEDEVGGGGGGGGGGEVDARADDFINRFRQQLKLQRLDSIMRYKETLNRNGGAGPGSTPPK
ncbi:pescadillo homolog [Ananas comosus]|uniref:Pescadillo homolog n=1 Tax=Ananas comosus TaxID=4615 RepID=A0A6P5EX75_ANACO|nr:pescadillo homolog [Ananas comosus]